jgi:hypothetical protein
MKIVDEEETLLGSEEALLIVLIKLLPRNLTSSPITLILKVMLSLNHCICYLSKVALNISLI